MAESIFIGWFGTVRFESTGSSVIFSGNLQAERFLGADGTAAAPTHGFYGTGDGDNGMYLSAADTLGFSAGGTLRLSVSTTAVTSTVPIVGTGTVSVTGGSILGATALQLGTTVTVSEGAANLLQLAQDDNFSLVRGYIQGFEQTAPSAPAANGYRIFAVDNGGKTELMVLFQSGAAIRLAIEV